MSIAVIIPARDAARVLPRTLTALEGADEVVVVDNGSRDATAAVALAHGARVVHLDRPSRPAARNAGAAATAAGRLAFLDADCVPRPGWLAALDRCLDDHPVVGGPVVVRAQRPSRVERFDTRWRLDNARTIAGQGWTGSGNLAVDRALFDRLGGFDTSFRHAGEDVDLCLRAGDVGFCAGAVVEHAAASSVRQLVARGARHGYGSTQLLRRHGVLGRADWRHPRPLVAGDWALARFGLEGERDLLWPARADYAGRVAGSAWAALRRAR